MNLLLKANELFKLIITIKAINDLDDLTINVTKFENILNKLINNLNMLYSILYIYTT